MEKESESKLKALLGGSNYVFMQNKHRTPQDDRLSFQFASGSKDKSSPKNHTGKNGGRKAREALFISHHCGSSGHGCHIS